MRGSSGTEKIWGNHEHMINAAGSLRSKTLEYFSVTCRYQAIFWVENGLRIWFLLHRIAFVPIPIGQLTISTELLSPAVFQLLIPSEEA